MKSSSALFPVWLVLCCATSGAHCQPPEIALSQKAIGSTFREVSLPSAVPSGIAVNDRILFRYYPALRPSGAKSPAVVLLHYLGGDGEDRRVARFARYLSRRGIAAAQMTLPYHGHRKPTNDSPHRHFVAGADTVAQAFAQSASDVSTVVTWLTQQPEVDAGRIGAVGVSLGAFVVHLAMGQDARINAGVAALGAGNLAAIFLQTPGRKPNAQEIETLRRVEPLAYADNNRPRRVLMIQAARDKLVPPRYTEQLWEALGRPPIQWADVNHTGLVLTLDSVMRTTAAYLETAWSDAPDDLSRVPRVRAITLKTGVISGLDTLFTPAVQGQFYSLGTRHHMALLHANFGLGLRGPFLGVAATVNRYLDVGVGRRVFGDNIRPYASLHIVF